MRTSGCFGLAAVLAAALVSDVAVAVDLNAVIKGNVSDVDGLPVPRAIVVVRSPDLLGERSDETDETGRFRFPGLPPGTYTVMVQHGFFDPWVSGELRVTQSQTMNLDIALAVKDSGEELTVYAAAPAVDTENTEMGVTLSADFLKDVPVNRDWASAMEVTPGIVGGGNANMHGGFDTSNQFYIDGVNITDPVTNTFSTNINYDAIESIQVITGGMDAEYGRSLGGALNIVTKSGGNEFEGSATALYSHPDMVVAPTLDGDSEGTDLTGQFALNLGGPIVKDRIWFFGSAQYDRYISTVSVDAEEVDRDMERFPIQPQDWQSLYLFGKITAQPTNAHRIWLQAQGDPTWIKNVEQNVYVLPSAETIQLQGGWLASLGHQFTPNDSMLLESQLYYQYSFIDYHSILWADCEDYDASTSACQDDFVGTQFMGEPVTESWFGYDQGFSSGEFPWASINRRYRGSLTSSLSLWFDLLGEHHAKIGVQADYMRSFGSYPGQTENGEVYAEPAAGPDGTVDPNDLTSYEPQQLWSYDNDWAARFDAFLIGWYIQDVWKPVPWLTVRPGVRFDYSNLRDDLGNSVFNRLVAGPRIGMAADLTGDGKTALHAYYGRFYDAGYLYISDLLRKGSTGIEAYNWDSETGDWAEEPSFVIADTFLAHDDLRNPYSDEINVGITREIARDVAMDVTFIYESSRRFWEDDEVNLIWDAEGSNVIGSRNGENVAVYRLRTPDDVFTRYTSLEFTLTKSFSDNWTVLGSYTWSRAYGTNSADGATGLYDIETQRQYEVGLLAYDVEHAVKTSGSYTDPSLFSAGRANMGYVLGWNFVLRSGFPYRRYVWNDYYAGYYNYDSVGDGRYRLPAYSQLDLRAGINLEAGPTAWMIGADCFNVFNSRTPTWVNSVFDEDAVGDDQPFGQILNRQGRRRFQVTIRGEF